MGKNFYKKKKKKKKKLAWDTWPNPSRPQTVAMVWERDQRPAEKCVYVYSVGESLVVELLASLPESRLLYHTCMGH